MGLAHEKLEKNIGILALATAIAVSLGGLAEIIPMMFQAEAIQPLPGVKPYPALELAEIAFLVGFSEAGSLARAFRRWTGRSPGAYRQSLLDSASQS